jgi:hypothetical protein
MGSKLEDIEFKHKNFQPGPGAYSLKPTLNEISMKFGTGSRAELSGGKETKMKPGPGNYEPKIQASLTASPKYGFGTGIRTEEPYNKAKKFVPGPGQYMSQSFVG